MVTLYSASVFVDIKNNILLIPTGKNEYGIGMSLNHPQKLVWDGGNFLELGEKMLEVFHVAMTHPRIKRDEAVKVYAEATGIKSWTQFAKKHQMISAIRIEEDQNYTFKFMRRRSDNSFGNNTGEVFPKRELPLTATAEEIGRAIIDVFTEAGALA